MPRGSASRGLRLLVLVGPFWRCPRQGPKWTVQVRAPLSPRVLRRRHGVTILILFVLVSLLGHGGRKKLVGACAPGEGTAKSITAGLLTNWTGIGVLGLGSLIVVAQFEMQFPDLLLNSALPRPIVLELGLGSRPPPIVLLLVGDSSLIVFGQHSLLRGLSLTGRRLFSSWSIDNLIVRVVVLSYLLGRMPLKSKSRSLPVGSVDRCWHRALHLLPATSLEHFQFAAHFKVLLAELLAHVFLVFGRSSALDVLLVSALVRGLGQLVLRLRAARVCMRLAKGARLAALRHWQIVFSGGLPHRGALQLWVLHFVEGGHRLLGRVLLTRLCLLRFWFARCVGQQRRGSVFILRHLIDVVLLLGIKLREFPNAKAASETSARPAESLTSRRGTRLGVLKQAVVGCSLLSSSSCSLVLPFSLLVCTNDPERRPHIVWLLFLSNLARSVRKSGVLALTGAGPAASSGAESLCRQPVRFGEGRPEGLDARPHPCPRSLPPRTGWRWFLPSRSLRIKVIDGLTQGALLALIVVH